MVLRGQKAQLLPSRADGVYNHAEDDGEGGAAGPHSSLVVREAYSFAEEPIADGVQHVIASDYGNASIYSPIPCHKPYADKPSE
jgi:hypothetical protein